MSDRNQPLRAVGGASRLRKAGVALVAALSLATCASAARAADVTYGFRNGQAAIMLKGEIADGDAMKVSRTMGAIRQAGSNVAVLAVDSPGGKVGEGVIIAELVRTQGVSTFIPSNARCASACFMIFAAGRNKVVGDNVAVGIHSASEHVMQRASSDGTAHETVTETKTSEVITEQVAIYVQKLGVPHYLAVRMQETPANDVTWLSNADLEAMGVTFSR